MSSSASAENPDTSTEATRQFFAMDTAMDITVYAEGGAETAVQKAVDEVLRLDEMLAAERDGSEVATLNRERQVMSSWDLERLIMASQEYYEATDGAFNICLYPVKKAWGFVDKNYRVPTDAELKGLLATADPMSVEFFEQIGLDWGLTSDNDGTEAGGQGTALIPGLRISEEGTEIDLGGIAKGYTADRLVEILKDAGATGAMLSLGGNVCLLGAKPDDKPWRVGIVDPNGQYRYGGILEVPGNRAGDGTSTTGEPRATSVVTSGGYERYFEEGGKTYHHILDPATGYPAESGIVSATIVSADGTLADVMSTAVFVMGVEKAAEYWRGSGYDFDMILLDDAGTMHVTEGLADRFTSDYPIEILHL